MTVGGNFARMEANAACDSFNLNRRDDLEAPRRLNPRPNNAFLLAEQIDADETRLLFKTH
jgi:hypothetical protein